MHDRFKSAAVLPALPEWCYRDDLGGLMPSEIRTALNEHARAAWNMGLDAGLPHAPAVTDTGLPELRDHLATAKVMDRTITLSPAAAGALHLAMTTPPSEAESATTTPQVAGYIEPLEVPCIGKCRTTLWATKQSPSAMAVFLAAPAVPAATDVCAEMRARCSSCGGTGDVTRIDGEWLGYCTCGSAK